MGELLKKFISDAEKVFVCSACNFPLSKESDLISKVQKSTSDAHIYIFSHSKVIVGQLTFSTTFIMS